jgi:hypothetical protein
MSRNRAKALGADMRHHLKQFFEPEGVIFTHAMAVHFDTAPTFTGFQNWLATEAMGDEPSWGWVRANLASLIELSIGIDLFLFFVNQLLGLLQYERTIGSPIWGCLKRIIVVSLIF